MFQRRKIRKLAFVCCILTAVSQLTFCMFLSYQHPFEHLIFLFRHIIYFSVESNDKTVSSAFSEWRKHFFPFICVCNFNKLSVIQ